MKVNSSIREASDTLADIGAAGLKLGAALSTHTVVQSCYRKDKTRVMRSLPHVTGYKRAQVCNGIY